MSVVQHVGQVILDPGHPHDAGEPYAGDADGSAIGSFALAEQQVARGRRALGPERGHGGRVADELVDAADLAVDTAFAHGSHLRQVRVCTRAALAMVAIRTGSRPGPVRRPGKID